MQDLPQQPPDYEVVIPLEQGDHGGVIQDDLEFQVLEPPTPPTAKLEEKDLFNLTHFLHRKYEKGFTWAELPHIIESIRVFVGSNPGMCLRDKGKAAVDTVHYLMVSLDTLYLPEKATDPFFEELLVPYIEVALAFPTEKALIKPSRCEALTKELLVDYAQQIKIRFEEEGLTWKNLSLATRYALTYVLSYEDLEKKDQVEGAFTIVETILTETDLSRFPAYYDEKLYKTFLRSFIVTQLSTPYA